MPLFTARLTDDEMDAFKRIAAGRPRAEVLREWIAGAGRVPDAMVLRGEREGGTFETRPKPPYVAAPDDDCAACGHDRQSYHTDGVCKCPTGPRTRCGCPAWKDPRNEEPLF